MAGRKGLDTKDAIESLDLTAQLFYWATFSCKQSAHACKKQKTSSARSELFFMMRHLLRVALDNIVLWKNMVSNMATRI